MAIAHQSRVPHAKFTIYCHVEREYSKSVFWSNKRVGDRLLEIFSKKYLSVSLEESGKLIWTIIAIVVRRISLTLWLVLAPIDVQPLKRLYRVYCEYIVKRWNLFCLTSSTRKRNSLLLSIVKFRIIYILAHFKKQTKKTRSWK